MNLGSSPPRLGAFSTSVTWLGRTATARGRYKLRARDRAPILAASHSSPMTAEPINHRGKRRSAVLIAAGLAVVAAAVIASLYVFASGGPLDGDMTHDFGVVQMTFGHPVELRHTFRLSNRTSKPLVVHSVKPDCGCVTTAAANAVIEPGALLELPITLTLSTVKKRALIRLDLGEDGSQMLRVDAAGRFDPQLFASLEELVLRPGRATSFVLTAYVFDTYDPPARPAISPPPAVAASFGGWKL